MMRSPLRQLCTLSMAVVVWAAAVLAQETTGSISGTVTDPTGAVIPSAKVSVTNLQKNLVVRKVRTDKNGTYVAALLPNGRYQLTAEAPGFKKYEKNDIEVNVNDHLTIDARMQPGAVSESVEVRADALQVDTQTAAATGLITGVQIRELALKSRNYEELVALMPGVTSDVGDNLYVGVSAPNGGGGTPGTNEVAFSLNGGNGYQNNWTIDGADNVDRGGNFTLLNYPSVDAISEFKVLRGNYNAEYGRAGGGQINVITNSGNSAFHGGIYEFFRNDVLDANSWINKHTNPIIPRQPFRYNDFGGTIGGPIFIPGHYNSERNKTFFFFSEELRRVTESVSSTAFVPNLQERGLDPTTGGIPTFADAICVTGNFDANGNCIDAANNPAPTATQIGPGTPFPLSPVALAYLKDIYSHIPLPQDPINDILVAPGRNVFNYRQEIVRVDHIFGPKFTVFGRYINDNIPTIESGGLFNGNAIPEITQTSTNSPGRNVVVTGTMSFSPTLLNELSYAYSFGGVVSSNVGQLLFAASPHIAAALNLPFPDILKRVPSIQFNALSSYFGFGNYRDFNRNFNIFDNLTKVMGKHTLKFGASFHWYEKSENSAGNNAGTFTFGSNNSNPPTNKFPIEQEWANFMLGNVASFTQLSTDFRAEVRQKEFEVYGQDEFRMRRNLTLSYGLRYSIFRQPTDVRGHNTSFDPALFNPANAPTLDSNGNLCLPTTLPCPGGVTPNPNADLLNGMIIGGKNSEFGHASPFGDAIARQNNLEFQPRLGVAWDPWSDGNTSVRAGYGIFVESPGIGFVENNLFSNPPFVQSITINNTSFDNPLAGTPSNNGPLTLAGAQPNWHQPSTQQWDLDIQHKVGASLLFDIGYFGSKGTHLAAIRDINQPVPGSYATNPLIQNNPNFTPGNQIDSTTATLLNLIRPFPGYGSINEYQTNFKSNYHSLQASVQKRFRGSSLISVNYTWSKNLTNLRTDPNFTAPQNSYDPTAEYGPSRFDRRHTFNADFVYELPWWRSQQSFVGHVLGGWELSGIIEVSSGSYLTATTTSSLDPGGVGLQAPTTVGRPDQLLDPNVGAPHNSTFWFNPNAFADVPSGVFRTGNARRASILGPGYQTWDMSLFKNIKLTERVGMQFRAEGFNIFNHTNFSSVDTTLGDAQFGMVTDAHAPRILQLGLKLNF